jgi:acyl-CoA oxidase
VFAKLMIDGQDYGVHVFMTQLRDPVSDALMPGVTVGDCGEKVVCRVFVSGHYRLQSDGVQGLHGVDNGFVAFHNVRVPLENLLNRFGDVLPDGTYKSPLPSVSAPAVCAVRERRG